MLRIGGVVSPVGFCVASAIFMFLVSAALPSWASQWHCAGDMAMDMSHSRSQHTATLLKDGRVLATGGVDHSGTYLASAEIYTPAPGNGCGQWTAATSMTTARSGHAAALLDNGKVLVSGGRRNNTGVSAEIYDPAHDEWVTAPDLNSRLHSHTATLLKNGDVFIAGGRGGTEVASVSLYMDDGQSYYPNVTAMAERRAGHTATRLNDGRVFIYGGGESVRKASAQIFDRQTMGWTHDTPSGSARVRHTATLLRNGDVLVVGGLAIHSSGADSETYNVALNIWEPVNHPSIYRRDWHTATMLPTGEVLVAGGPHATAEMFEPRTRSWAAVPIMANARQMHTATLLNTGRVLVVGGRGTQHSLWASELFEPEGIFRNSFGDW